jgi:succinate dehydrogenase flavin-adding protein (antitoxin of CptAB toxin-antitoxin module)
MFGIRSNFTTEQTDALSNYYESQTTYPTTNQKTELALQLGLTDKQIADWFHNRRKKDKKKNS